MDTSGYRARTHQNFSNLTSHLPFQDGLKCMHYTFRFKPCIVWTLCTNMQTHIAYFSNLLTVTPVLTLAKLIIPSEESTIEGESNSESNLCNTCNSTILISDIR